MSQLERMQDEMLDWIRPIMGDDDRDVVNTAIKLSEEVSELLHALYTRNSKDGEEIVDCLILLLDIAFLRGVDVEREFNNKMSINRCRTWTKSKGCLKHED